MPELPDVTIYRERLDVLLRGRVLEAVRVHKSFLVRSVAPPLVVVHGWRVVAVHRLGKRIVLELDGELFLVLHLMIAGRLRWLPRSELMPARPPAGRIDLAAFDFAHGTLAFTEAGSKKRASLHVVQGRESMAQFDRGGLEVEGADPSAFAAVLRRENRTLKRALCDPTLFSGIGNAYSDEILHAARLSPVQLTSQLTEADVERLRQAIVTTLQHWTARLRAEAGPGLPVKVTAFREGMAVHGRFGKPCPVCQAPVQRIRYADNECNYCAQCQCGGRLLRDRGLSLLLKSDWPKTLAELEERRRGG